MVLTNKQKQEALRKRRASAGIKELRDVWIDTNAIGNVWVTKEEKVMLKAVIEKALVEYRNNRQKRPCKEYVA